MDWSPFLRVLFAAVLAVPIGLDRELRGKPAGLRTHVVVAAASSALGALSVFGAEVVGADQTRIASTVVTGIGFMGAGIIFASGGKVHGLTTAAALWSAMAAGLCVGMGADALAISLVTVTLVFLWPAEWLLGWALAGRNKEDRTVFVAAQGWDGVAAAHETIVRTGGRAHDLAVEAAGEYLTARLRIHSTDDVARDLLGELRGLDGVAFAVVETPSEDGGEELKPAG